MYKFKIFLKRVFWESFLGSWVPCLIKLILGWVSPATEFNLLSCLAGMVALVAVFAIYDLWIKKKVEPQGLSVLDSSHRSARCSLRRFAAAPVPHPRPEAVVRPDFRASVCQ